MTLVDKIGKVTVIEPQSTMSNEDVIELEHSFSKAVSENRSLIILNFENINHLTSSTLALIISYKKQFEAKGGDLKIVTTSDKLLHLLKITMTSKVFEIYHSMTEALHSYSN